MHYCSYQILKGYLVRTRSSPSIVIFRAMVGAILRFSRPIISIGRQSKPCEVICLGHGVQQTDDCDLISERPLTVGLFILASLAE